MRRRIYATLIAGALAVSAMGTTVMAADGPSATGETDFSYTPGTAGPTDPVDPGQEDTSPNNWMVTYPRQVVLTDSNIGQAGDATTKGAKLDFVVKQKVAGAKGDYVVTADNVGDGIKVVPSANGWTTGTAINMDGAKASEVVQMSLATSDSSPSLVSQGGTMTTLTSQDYDKTGYALLTNAVDAVDGTQYTKAVTFTFTRTQQ